MPAARWRARGVAEGVVGRSGADMPVAKGRFWIYAASRRTLVGEGWAGIISPRLLLSRTNQKTPCNTSNNAVSNRTGSNDFFDHMTVEVMEIDTHTQVQPGDGQNSVQAVLVAVWEVLCVLAG